MQDEGVKRIKEIEAKSGLKNLTSADFEMISNLFKKKSEEEVKKEKDKRP